MSTVSVATTRIVDAPATTVYDILSDYRQHHPRVLPPAFSGFEVEEGGRGEGTVVRFTVTAGGRSRAYRMRVSEPDPGKVLRESDTASSLVTTYTLAPEANRTRVRIETSWQGAAGVGGFFERLFAPGAMRRIYDDALTRLDGYARTLEAPGTA